MTTQENRIILGIQKSGKLYDGTKEVLSKCGIDITTRKNSFLVNPKSFPISIYCLRDDDIAGFVDKNVCDIGILGLNTLNEYTLEHSYSNVQITNKLGFSRCRLSLAVPSYKPYEGFSFFNGKKVATSYPQLLSQFFKQNGVQNYSIITMNGSVELATQVGIADGICDIVSTGSTLASNQLSEKEVLLESEAVLLQNKGLSPEKTIILQRLVKRLQSVINARIDQYVLFHCPSDKVNEAAHACPGLESPTILPLKDPAKVAMHAVVEKDLVWDTLEKLEIIGCSSIVVLPVEKTL